MTAAQQHLRELVTGRWCDIQAHLENLTDYVVAIDATRVVELGVRTGNSTTALLAGVEQTDGRLWSVDVAEHKAPDAVAKHPRWTFTQGDSIDPHTFGYLPFTAIDLLFIDTSHTLEQTTAELAMYGNLVRQDGLVVLHDADEDGVILAARSWALGNGFHMHMAPLDHGLLTISVHRGGRVVTDYVLFNPAGTTADALARWAKARTSLDRGRVQATGDLLAQRIRDLEATLDGLTDQVRKLELAGDPRDLMADAGEPGGTTCPTCQQHVQVYRRKINSGMAAGLISLHRAADADGYVDHVPDRPGGSWEEGKLEYWGLVVRVPKANGRGIAGWRITEFGRRFVEGTAHVRKYVRIYDGVMVGGPEGPSVSIREALGTRFNYDDMMAGV